MVPDKINKTEKLSKNIIFKRVKEDIHRNEKGNKTIDTEQLNITTVCDLIPIHFQMQKKTRLLSRKIYITKFD